MILCYIISLVWDGLCYFHIYPYILFIPVTGTRKNDFKNVITNMWSKNIWNSEWVLMNFPFVNQNFQSANIWGWWGGKRDRAVRWPLRLHEAQRGECSLCRNPVQGTAQTHSSTHNASLFPVFALCFLLLYLWCIICVTQIGHRHVVDATLQEKACSVASVLISVTHRGTVTCVRKMGGGSLDPESIFEMTEVRICTQLSFYFFK